MSMRSQGWRRTAATEMMMRSRRQAHKMKPWLKTTPCSASKGIQVRSVTSLTPAAVRYSADGCIARHAEGVPHLRAARCDVHTLYMLDFRSALRSN